MSPRRPSNENAISTKVRCPACFAEVDAPCSTPTNTGRRDVAWFHSSRTTKAAAYLTHEVGVHAEGGHIAAICTCGWSKLVRTDGNTSIDLLEALRTLAPGAGAEHLRTIREDVSG
ncbi:hypothetical protein HOT31_gp141 [Microbacterium phage Hendrix]|uniref:DNA-binding phage zinc finger domain-containing protein n=1 Tax=Microbacterium phage Hendrix TaxID=2182341 RepID=A0A2U8UUE2_9CAUD|nr:hypothetical protein HOT31_gp141 [Microbacterium phage Hendrix]AWN07811.1 hypothetical protein PBI_HENDRIX_140 [Microbacterium phage Hendrix]